MKESTCGDKKMEAYYKEVVTSFFLGGGILAGS
jgi:hypothetical protein